MAVDPWMIDASGGTPAYTAQEARLLTVVPMFAGAGASLGVRTGVRPSGSNTDLLVQAQGSPNMSVLVNPGVITAQGSISATQGAYTWALDAATTLTIAAAHATLSRTDLVVVRIRDAGVDTSGQRDGAPAVITGTAGGGVPSLPVDATYVTIAQVAVAATVTTIVAGNITSKRQFTAASGGVIYCPSAAEQPAASSVPLSQIAYRSDLDMFRRTDGTSWFALAPYRRKTVLGATTPSVTFSFPVTTLSQIRLNIAARSTKAALSDDIAIRLNSDSTAGSYRWVYRFALSSVAPSVTSSFSDTMALIGTVPGATTTGGYFGATEAVLDACNGVQSMIPYTAHSAFVTDTTYVISDCGGTYWPTGNISSVTILSASGSSFVTNSVFELWGWE